MNSPKKKAVIKILSPQIILQRRVNVYLKKTQLFPRLQGVQNLPEGGDLTVSKGGGPNA